MEKVDGVATSTKTLTYDGAGNLITDGEFTYTWQMGRQLQGITGTGLNTSYKYNENGLRTEKTVNGQTHEYTLLGSSVTREVIRDSQGNILWTIHYSYAGDSTPVSMNVNGTEYYYLKNAQGDITHIVDCDGVEVASYRYDAWGNHLSITGGDIAELNPYRYRGYRYDSERGLFYVGSRYYDPEIGRFINADTTDVLILDYHNMSQYNLFAYCNNNPVNDFDDDGQLSFLAKIAIGLAAVAVGATVVALTGGTAAAFVPALVAGVKAAAISGAIGATVGAGTSVVSHRVSTGSWKGSGKAALSGAVDGFADGFMTGGIMAGAGMTAGSLLKNAKGLQIGKTAKPQYGKANIGYGTPKTSGNTLLSIQNKAGKCIFRFDMDAVNAVHMHLPQLLSKTHIPIGSIGTGLYSGVKRW